MELGYYDWKKDWERNNPDNKPVIYKLDLR